MVNKNNIVLIIAVIIGIVVYDSYFRPKAEAENKLKEVVAREKLINFWSKPTVDFAENFNCAELKFEKIDLEIKKFIVIESYESCNINLDTDMEFEKLSMFKNYYTRKIDDANVIIWIQQKPGKAEGTYSNSTKAIRYCAELNFIDKVSKIIYKREVVDFLGAPPDEITRRQGTHGGNEFFGAKPEEEIYSVIIREINKI